MCRSRRYLIGILIASALLTTRLRADIIGTGGQVGIVRTLSAYTLGLTGLNTGAALKYDGDTRFVSAHTGNVTVMDADEPVDRQAAHLLSGDLFLTFGALPTADIGLCLPLYSDICGWGPTDAGMGDLELTAKVAIPLASDPPLFAHALFCRFIFPTGASNRGYFPRHSYHIDSAAAGGDHPFTTGTFAINPTLIWSLDLEPLLPACPIQMHANIGAVIITQSCRSALTAAAGVACTPLPQLTLFVELSSEVRVSSYTDSWSLRSLENNPIRLTPGGRLTLPFGMYITCAGDFGLSTDEKEARTDWECNGYSYATTPAPTYGVQLTIGWQGQLVEPDSDKDGIRDARDRCPHAPEDYDAFEDADGCPDTDDDQDGLPDAIDQCPHEYAKCDGCPKRHKDNDGVEDADDKCPELAEDLDGHEDEDGCPDYDNDADGVPDDVDRCVDSPEDIDRFEDADGCPDMDNDRDGVADQWEKCPETPGATDNNGCPKAKKIMREPLLLRGVSFRPGKALLTPNSYQLLDDVCASLAQWTDVQIEIQGHTDSQGAAEANQRLSQRRAEAIRDYLIRKGISPTRLHAIGYGETRPIASNASATGRNRNRRVELHRID